MLYDLLVVGGGAAGFFAAVNAARFAPGCRILILEQAKAPLAKVRISGGGRCNVTHACFDIPDLLKFYPRGQKELRQLFARFATQDTVNWFESRGVKLKAEADGRMFPVTDSSSSIIDCLMLEARKYGVGLALQTDVVKLEMRNQEIVLYSRQQLAYRAKRVLLASGGHPKLEGYRWLQDLGIDIVPPVPSLFTFNLPKHPICELMGLSVANARVRLPEFKQEQSGPLLITHWGLSGPAVIKLSAMAARELHTREYRFKILVDWLPNESAEDLRALFSDYRQYAGATLLSNRFEVDLPARLKQFLMTQAAISPGQRWSEVNNKQINRLVEVLKNHEFFATGKTTFKEEFVTSGGISRSEIDFRSMQLRKHPNIYVAGELIDIDALTGGFNFQAAWSAGFAVATHFAQAAEAEQA
jgi:predicted Rossmann fold flavoprotein